MTRPLCPCLLPPRPLLSTMLRKTLLSALAWFTLWQPIVAVQTRSLLLPNDTLLTPGSEPKGDVSTHAPCFPALDFKMPACIPDSLDGWWCDSNTEYAFVGFSYEITQCKFHPSPLSDRSSTFVAYRPEQESIELRVRRYS